MPPEAATDEDEDEGELIDSPQDEDEVVVEDPPEVKSLAVQLGWKDPKNWKGEPPAGGLKTAKDFIAEIPEVMRNTRKKADTLEQKYNRVVAQVAKLDRHVSAKDDLDAKAAARTAFEAGDFDEAEKILTATRASSAAPDEAPALTAFKERNEWYGSDDEATAYVASLDQQFAKAAGGVQDPEAHMRKIEVAVKKRFPELFEAEGRRREEPPAGERRRAPLVQRGAGDRQRSTADLTAADLTPAQRRAAAEYGVTPEAYAKQVNRLKAS